MSTILDALRKLQRERAAQVPDKDLRSSITHEANRGQRRGRGARNIGLALSLLAIAGGGYVLYRSGQIQQLLAGFSSDGDDVVTEEDFAAVEREMLEREAAAAAQQAAAQADTPPVAEPPPAPAARLPRNAPQPPGAGAPAGDSPELLAERARLEAALANARAAQEAQQQAALEAQVTAEQAAASPPPPEPSTDAAVIPAPPAPPPVPQPTQKRVVAQRKPPAPAQPTSPVVAAPTQPKPRAPVEREDAEPEARAVPRAAAGPAPSRAAFPEVWVESIRWHPVAERRVASLRFERQNAPEAREGDIVAGVLVYRIDPGSVELRVGGAQRTVLPGP